MARTSAVFFPKCVATFLFLLLAAGVVSSGQTVAQDRVRGTIDDSQMYVVPGNVHALAQPEFDQGRADSAMKINRASIVFKPSPAQQNAIEALLAAQQDRTSPSYHKWLTPEQYADRFGMTRNDLAKVASWLQSKGLAVNGTARGRNRVFFTGTAAQIEDVFQTEIHRYLVDGEFHFANATELSVPVAFADTVLSFGNLNDFRPQPRARMVKAHFTSSLLGSHFVAPDDFATIYDLKALYSSGFDGTGGTIAVVGQTAISATCTGVVCNTTDIDAFRSASVLPATNLQQILVTGSGTPTVLSTGDLNEADLDIEWSGAVARNAAIIFVYTGNSKNFNVFDSLDFAIQNKLAPVISISYGNCEANLGGAGAGSFVFTLQQEALQANLQGQTIISATGDSGAADCDPAGATSATHGYAVDAPSSVPEVTGVGGSEFFNDPLSVPPVPPTDTTYWTGANNSNMGSAKKYIPETAWNDTPGTGTHLDTTLSSGGGGASAVFSKPAWQTGTGVPSDGKRDVPDISLNASPPHDGYLFCTQGSCVNGYRGSNGSLVVVGGTSAGAPTFAGIVAIINQATKSSSGLGNVNPELYTLAATESATLSQCNGSNIATPPIGTCIFRDITMGSNKVPCTTGTTGCPSGTTSIGFMAGTGYDQATGLGSVDANNLVRNWTGFSATPDFAVGGTALNLGSPGRSGASTITVTAMNGFMGTVALSFTPCSTTAEITCTLNPSSVMVSGSSMTATLSVSTMAPHALARTSAEVQRPAGLGWFAASGGALLAGFLAMAVPSRRRRWSGLLGILFLTFVAAGISCGGGTSSHTLTGGTPVGTYTVAVTATDGSLSHTTNVAITVQ